MSDQLNKEEEDLLQSALSDAFTPASVPRVPATDAAFAPSTHQPLPPSGQPTPAAPPSEPQPTSAEDAWKLDYEAQVAEWRAQNAQQRQRAEEERARWEMLREKEEKEGKVWSGRDIEGKEVRGPLEQEHLARLKAAGAGAERAANAEEKGKGKEVAPLGGSPSPADARDLVSGEKEGRHVREFLAPGNPSASSTPPHDGVDTDTDSPKHDKWEDIPSDLASSYPSLSFPSDPHSPVSAHHQSLHPQGLHHEHAHHHAHSQHDHPHPQEIQKASATSAIFDSSLSTKTRTLALISSLAINLLLPFVNGVMLGFGEIFARNVVVGWFGWKVPGNSATNVGVRATGRSYGDVVKPTTSKLSTTQRLSTAEKL